MKNVIQYGYYASPLKAQGNAQHMGHIESNSKRAIEGSGNPLEILFALFSLQFDIFHFLN